MLISDRHRFIFIHNPKCAGTSIHKALAPYSNYMCRLANTSTSYYSRRIFGEREILSNYSHHISASELMDKIGSEKYKRYYSFGVVRNPYDRAVSNFKYISRSKTHDLHSVYYEFESFEDYVKKLHTLIWIDPQFHYLTNKGKILVDKVMKFENLDQDFKDFLHKFNLTEVELKRHNTSQRLSNYLSYYDDEMIDIINREFDEDFRIFGYEKIKT
jgi:hypothetical protein